MNAEKLETCIYEIHDLLKELVRFTVRGYSTRYVEEFGFHPALTIGSTLPIQKRTRRKFLVRSITVSITGAAATGTLSFGPNLNLGGGDSRQLDFPNGLTSIPVQIMLTEKDDRVFTAVGATGKVSVILTGEEIAEGAGSPPTTKQGQTFSA